MHKATCEVGGWRHEHTNQRKEAILLTVFPIVGAKVSSLETITVNRERQHASINFLKLGHVALVLCGPRGPCNPTPTATTTVTTHPSQASVLPAAK